MGRATATSFGGNVSINDAFNRKLIQNGVQSGVRLTELPMTNEMLAKWTAAERKTSASNTQLSHPRLLSAQGYTTGGLPPRVGRPVSGVQLMRGNASTKNVNTLKNNASSGNLDSSMPRLRLPNNASSKTLLGAVANKSQRRRLISAKV
jgi:hypothetical protein